MDIRVVADGIIARYASQLAQLGPRAPQALASALNHEGRKAFTQVKRVLVTQTGINYGQIEGQMKTRFAFPGRLRFEIQADGHETNLGAYQARQTGAGVSAAPWNDRHTFGQPGRASFFLPGSRRVFIREGKARYSIKPLFGPNLARELVKDESKAAWAVVLPSLSARVGHEIRRLLPR
jgi:hypothetical protein